MPHRWYRQIRAAKKLRVLNKAQSWAVSVNAAIKLFNALSFGVELLAADQEKDANVVTLLATSAKDTYPYPFRKTTIGPGDKFDPSQLHGAAANAYDSRDLIEFSVIFLPGKVKKPTKNQKMMLALHELIHAAGLDGWHDTEGIMYPRFIAQDEGVIELRAGREARPDGEVPMPPVRVGHQTLCKMKSLWSDGPVEGCPTD